MNGDLFVYANKEWRTTSNRYGDGGEAYKNAVNAYIAATKGGTQDATEGGSSEDEITGAGGGGIQGGAESSIPANTTDLSEYLDRLKSGDLDDIIVKVNEDGTKGYTLLIGDDKSKSYTLNAGSVGQAILDAYIGAYEDGALGYGDKLFVEKNYENLFKGTLSKEELSGLLKSMVENGLIDVDEENDGEADYDAAGNLIYKTNAFGQKLLDTLLKNNLTDEYELESFEKWYEENHSQTNPDDGGGGGGDKNNATITNPYLSNVSALADSQARDAWANQGMIKDAEHRAEAYQALSDDEKPSYVAYVDKRGTGDKGVYTKGLDSAGDGDDFSIVINGKEYKLETSLAVGEKTKNILEGIAPGTQSGTAVVFGGDLYVKYNDNWYSTSSRLFGSRQDYWNAVEAYKGAASSSSDIIIDAETLGKEQERDAWANQDAIDDVTNRINIALNLSPEDQKDLFYSSKESSYDNTGYKVKNLTHFGDGDDFDLVIQRKTYGLEVGHKITDTTITDHLNKTAPGNVAVACGDLLVKDGNGNWYTTSSRFLGSVNTYREAAKAFKDLKNEVTINGADVGEAIDIPYTTVQVDSEAIGAGVVGNSDNLGTGSPGALKATADGLYIYQGNQWMQVNDDEAYNQYLLEYAIQTGKAPFNNTEVLNNAKSDYKTPQNRSHKPEENETTAQINRLKAAYKTLGNADNQNIKFSEDTNVEGVYSTSGEAFKTIIRGKQYTLNTGTKIEDQYVINILNNNAINTNTRTELTYAYGDLYLCIDGTWYSVYGKDYKSVAEAYRDLYHGAGTASNTNPYELLSGSPREKTPGNNVDYNKLLNA
jgi:hypothetical protein